MPTQNLVEKFKDWAGNSSVVGIPVVLAMVGYGFVSSAVGGLKFKFDLATKPLSYFEPQPPEEIASVSGMLGVHAYTQELALSREFFGDGRAAALLKRLGAENLPVVEYNAQVWALTQSTAGLTHLPEHEKLVQYGLNDLLLMESAGRIGLAVRRALRNLQTPVEKRSVEAGNGPADFDSKITGVIGPDGVRLESGEMLVDKERLLQIAIKPSLYSFSVYEGADPAIPDCIANVVYGWLYEDILPSIPQAVGEMSVPKYSAAWKHSQLPEMKL